jgi:hypothetical protein
MPSRAASYGSTSMTTGSVLRIVVILLAATSAAGCSGPLDKAPRPVRDALDPFLKAGYACAGPSSDNSAFSQWQCDRLSAGVHAFVVLDGDDSGVKQVTATVDQAGATQKTRDVALAFFNDVASINVSGSAAAVHDWVAAHIAEGGQEQVDSVLVTLDSFQTVDHLVVFAPG